MRLNLYSNYFFISLVILLFLFPPKLASQELGKLRGFLTNEASGEALAFGNVYIEELNTGASTDVNGYFIISAIPSNKIYTVLVSYVGFESKKISVFILPGKITELNISLKSSGIELQEIEKIGKEVISTNETDLNLLRISVKKLETMPKGVEADLFRTLQHTPGVQFVGDVSARYFVRGGANDQNLVLLNGVEVYNPFHALGLFSIFDPDMMNSVEFYKGGFAAEYGGRLSSVLSVKTKDGNRNSFSGMAGASLLTAKSVIGGPFPGGSFLFSGRKSLSNNILKKFYNDQNVPIDFYDLSFKLNFSDPDLIKNGRFTLFTFLSNDKIENQDITGEDIVWTNNLFSFEWMQVYDVPLYSKLGISYSKFKGDSKSDASLVKPRKNSVSDFTLSANVTYVFNNKNELSFGLKLKSVDTKLDVENINGVRSNIEKFAGKLDIFGKYKFLQFNNFGMDLGSRLNLTGLNQNGGFLPEPRMNTTYAVLPFLTLKASWGIYIQELTTLSDENEVISLFEPWIILPDYLEPSRSIQYSFGLEYFMQEDTKFTVEGYYKIFQNLPLLNQNKIFEFEDDLLSGKGESYGWEFQFEQSFKELVFQAGYTISWAYREFDNFIYYPKYDSRHKVNLFLEYKFLNGFTISATWNFNNGLPYTQLLGNYNKLNIGNLYNSGNEFSDYNLYAILGDKNIARLPHYHRLDLGISKQFKFGFTNVFLSASIVNVYNRENLFYYNRDTGKRVNMLPFLPSASIKVEI